MESAKYAFIDEVIRGEHDGKLVRVTAEVTNYEQESNKIVLKEKQNMIVCVDESQHTVSVFNGQLLQVIGTVVPQTPYPCIKATILRSMSGIDYETYCLAVTEFRKHVL